MSYIQPRPRWDISKKLLLSLPQHDAPKKRNSAPLTITASSPRVETDDPRRILVITVWRSTERLFTVYIDTYSLYGGRDITYIHTDRRWSEGDLGYNMNHTARMWNWKKPDSVYIPEKDGEVIGQYFSDYTTAPLVLIENELRSHRDARYQHRTETRRSTAQRIADQRKPLPHDFERWINNHLFADQRYITYTRQGNTIHGRCSHCQQYVTIPAKKGMKHHSEVKCPACGVKAQLYASGRSASGRIAMTAYAIVANRIDEGLLLRCVPVSQTIDLGFGERTYTVQSEIALYVVGIKGDISLEWLYNNTAREYYWDKAREPSMMHTPYFKCGLLYTANLYRELRGTVWQHSALELLSKALPSVGEQTISSYLDLARRDPFVERLMRVGLYNLAVHKSTYYNYSRVYSTQSVLDTTQKKLHRALGVQRADMPLLRRLNVDEDELRLYRRIRDRTQHPERLIKHLRSIRITPQSLDGIIDRIGAQHIERLLYTYVPAQMTESPEIYTGAHTVINDYRDYLAQCTELNRDLDDTSNLWPSDLHKRHTELSQLITRKKAMIQDKAVRHRWKTEHRDYEYTSSGFTVLMPRNASEIINEGKVMCHCVATYADRVARGETTILFVRSTADRSKPLATAEVHNGVTRQIRGKKNSTPDAALMAFWEEYERNILKPLFAERDKIKVKAG